MWITYFVGRDSRTGKFLPLAIARRRKSTATVEMVRYRLH